jgi:flagellar biosynthesis/type III secretory pathway M-ring protein FliF/YscJ
MRRLRAGEGFMSNMDVWSWVLLGIGVFVAVSGLVRLMRRRRDEVLAELTAQAREEQHKKKLAEKLEKKKQKKQKAA